MQTLNQDIKEKTFKRVYLLFGDEPFLVNSYKKRLREAIAGDDTMNYNYFEGKGPDVKEIISLADTMPFFAERRLVMVDGSGFFKNSAPEELVNYIAEIPESTCMVFVESEVDKRNKLYKKVKDNGYAAELKKQDADQLMRWAAGILAKDGKKITRQVMEYFMERTGDDMENIRMELEKLICYTMGREVITKEPGLLDEGALPAYVGRQVQKEVERRMDESLQNMSNRVYRKLEQKLRTERERRGLV